MRSLLRIVGLFLPLLLTVAVAVGVVFTILRSPVVLITLAIGTGVLCLLVVAAAIFVGARGNHAERARRERVRDAVASVVRAPADPAARRALALVIDDMDEVRMTTELVFPDDRATIRRVLVEIGAADRLRRAAMRGRWERVMAARNLAWLGPTDAVAWLDGLARSADHDVAHAGAMGLAATYGPLAYRALVRLLARGPLPASRVAALLESSPYEDAVRILTEELDGAPPAQRFWTAFLAGRTGDERAPELLRRLAGDADPNVRANAAEAIGAIAGDRGHELLLELARDSVWYVRAHAARALGGHGIDGAGRLAELLADETWWVRESAAAALRSIGSDSIPMLRDTLSSSDRFARNKAAEVLVELGYIERQLDAFTNGSGESGEARQNLLMLGRAEAITSLSDRILAASVAPRSDLEAILIEIDDPRLQSTLEALRQRRVSNPVHREAGA